MQFAGKRNRRLTERGSLLLFRFLEYYWSGVRQNKLSFCSGINKDQFLSHKPIYHKQNNEHFLPLSSHLK